MLTLIKRKQESYIKFRVDFKVREVIRDKDGQDMMIKGSINQEDITILNVHAPNNRAFKVCEAKTDSP